jgi:hypothetical protein
MDEREHMIFDGADPYPHWGEPTLERLMSDGPTGDPRFHALLRQIGELHDAKQRDYGSDIDPFANVRGSARWGVEPWIGAMVRASDKVHRLQSYVANGSLANEGVEDSLMDLAVYALISLILFREKDAGINPE